MVGAEAALTWVVFPEDFAWSDRNRIRAGNEEGHRRWMGIRSCAVTSDRGEARAALCLPGASPEWVPPPRCLSLPHCSPSHPRLALGPGLLGPLPSPQLAQTPGPSPRWHCSGGLSLAALPELQGGNGIEERSKQHSSFQVKPHPQCDGGDIVPAHAGPLSRLGHSLVLLSAPPPAPPGPTCLGRGPLFGLSSCSDHFPGS